MRLWSDGIEVENESGLDAEAADSWINGKTSRFESTFGQRMRTETSSRPKA